MYDFLVFLGLVCVLPFVLAMLELQIKAWKRSATTICDRTAGAGRSTPVQRLGTDDTARVFMPVIYPPGLTGRWDQACFPTALSEGASPFTELVLNETWLPASSAGESNSRSVVLKPFRHEQEPRSRRNGWTSLN
jgi:hypothetical protein